MTKTPAYDTVKELPGYPVQNSPSGNFSWGGAVGRVEIVYDILCEWDASEGNPGQSCVHLYARILSTSFTSVSIKGVGPGPTLAWPGWKQPDISVKVDTARLEAGQFKKCCMECVLLYYPSTEFQSTFNVYWHGEGAAGLSCTELSIWGFPFLRGVCWQGWTSIWYCEKGMPQKDTLDNLRTPVCFRILSSSLTSVSIFSVCWYSSV